jgi:hypothetical protein
MANILVPILTWNGDTDVQPVLLTHCEFSHTVVLSIVGLTAYGAGATLTVQTSPCGSDVNSDVSWTAMQWEDGTSVVFTADGSCETDSVSMYVRVKSDKAVPKEVQVYLK